MSDIDGAENSTEVAQSAAHPPHKPARPTWLVASAVGLVVALIVGVVAAGFVWPFKASDPKGISFGVAGPAPQLELVEAQLTEAQPGVFEVTTFDDRDAVVTAIEKREISGGLVVGAEGTEMLTASAGNAQIAQMLTQMATAMKQQQTTAAQEAVAGAVAQAKTQGIPAEQILVIQEAAQEQAAKMTVTVTDVVPGGPLAMAGNLVMLPALIGGMATAVLALFLVKRPWYRIIAVASGAIFAGLVAALVLGPWMDIVQSNFGMLWLALSAAIGAIAATIMGLGTLFGRAGLGVGVVLMMLVGNPWGGAFVPREFLGGCMGWLGSVMPNGNLIEVVKNISFFPEASQAPQWWAFAAWAAIGIVLWAIGAALQTRKANQEPEAVAA